MDTDKKISAILRDDAPPRHDPMFRLRVLERIERKRFQRKLAVLFAAATLALAGLWIGADAWAASRRLDVLLLCAVLALSLLAHGPVLTHFARKLWTRAAQQQRS